MAEKYRIEFSSIKYNIPYRLSIYDDDYAGTPIQLNSANPPVVMRKDSDGIFSGTSLDIGIEVPVSMPWGITDLYSKSIRDHKVELYKSEVLIWAGYMVPEEYSDPLIAPPFDIALRAVDGIGTLKDFDFSLPANGTIQHTVVNYGLGDMITSTCTESEPVSQLKIIQHCLAKLSLSLPLAVLMNISESRHNSLYSALSQTYMNPSAFYDEDGDPLTCDKVISLILASYDPEITLTQHAGHWMITRAIDTPDNSYIIYDATGVCTATGVSLVESIAVDSVDNYTPSHCFPIGQLTRAFYPQMKKYTINKELQLKANFNPFTTSDDAFFYDEAKAKYISKLYCSIAQSGMTVTKFIMSDGTMAHFVSGKVYDISGYNVDSTYTYNYNSNGRDVKITIPIAIIHATITGSLAVTINGSTFDVPISKAASDCSLTELTLYKSTTEGAQSLSISFNIPTSAYSVLLGDVSISFVPFVSEDAFISSIEADVLINSDALKSETIDSFGDCPAETVSSHIWNSGFFLSDKTPTGTWKMKADTEYTSLMSNVARSIASNNRVARQQYSGVLMGEKLTPNSIIKHEANDNKIFRIVTASHNLREDELEVEILELLPFAEASTTISTTSIYSDAKKTNTTVNGANDYTVYGGNVGIGRRIYQLPTANDTTGLWVMADKEGTEEAQKVPLPKSVSAFSQLTDVALTDLAVGQFAYFNGEKWINTTLFVYDSVTNTFRFKANVVAEGEVTAWAAGSSNSNIWDSLPTASATTKGGIKIGSGLTIVDGVVSVDASAVGGNQTLTLNGSTLSISNGNSVNLSTLTPTWINIQGKPATFTPSAHDHSFDSLTGKKTTLGGYGITDAVDTYSGVCGTIIDSTTFATSFCQDIFGTEAVGFFLREIRTNANAPASLLNDYASGLAWKGGDTFGSLMVSFKNPNIRVSGGAQKDVVWVADLWHDKNFNPANKADLNGSSSVNFYASALTASSVTVSGLNASTVLVSDSAKGVVSSSVTSDKLIQLAQMFDFAMSGNTQYIKANFSLASVGELAAYSAGASFDNVWNQMPLATTTSKGGVIIGAGLTIASGVVSVDGSYGAQTLSFDGVNLSISGSSGNSVNLSTLTPTWDSITGKPATFTATAHRHSYSDLDNVPATFAPSTHSHSYSSLTDKPTSFTPSSHSHTYASILDKPATFTPSAHDHSFASLTSKPTTLPGFGVTDGVLGVELADSTSFTSSFCQDIFGTTSPGYFLREIRTRATAPSSLLGGYASGLVWKGADTYGSLMVAFSSSQIRVSGGAGNNPAWTVDLWHNGNFNPATKAELNGSTGVAFNTATLNVNGDFQINGKTAIRKQDDWLFINDPKNFTSGIYCGPGILRTDGVFQVGDGGVNFMIEGRTTTIGGLVKLKYVANELYNKIDFCNDSLVSHAAIHAFSTAWASGSVALSSGCINLDSTNGVTIGNWDRPALWIDSANRRTGINRVATSFACEVAGKLAVGDYTDGTALIASHSGNAYFGCETAENGVVVNRSGDVSTGNGAIILRKEGGIEIYHASTPYIDFHYANSALDYTTRLIEISEGNLQLIGNFVSTGEVTAYSSSDATLKTSVQDIQGRALSTLKRLRPVEFEWNDIAKKLNPEFARHTHSASFIAQEWETVFGWATHTIWGKYKSIDKNILFPYLVAGVNELDYKIDTVEDRLNRRIEELENEVKQLKSRI